MIKKILSTAYVLIQKPLYAGYPRRSYNSSNNHLDIQKLVNRKPKPKTVSKLWGRGDASTAGGHYPF